MTSYAMKADTFDDSFRFNGGVVAGVAGYCGDAGNNVFSRPGFTVGLCGSYLFNSRVSAGLSASVLRLNGSTAGNRNALPFDNDVAFSTTAFDFGARCEFNFLPYGEWPAYLRLRRATPFITLGLGGSVARCESSTSVSPNLPFGFGVKYRLNKQTNLVGLLTVTKTFSDKIDGEKLDDPLGIHSSPLKNNDWYVALTFGLTLDFGLRCATCNNIE